MTPKLLAASAVSAYATAKASSAVASREPGDNPTVKRLVVVAIAAVFTELTQPILERSLGSKST